MKRTRNTNLDLLRIISMLMVVCFHFFNHGGLVDGALVPWTANWFLGNLVYAGCFVAVNCFVLLSGYFQCTSKFKLKRLLSVWLQVFSWSVAICVFQTVIRGTFSAGDLLRNFLPITMRRYWFVTAYLLMYAVSPFLNCAIQEMNRKTHLLCCVVLMGIFSVLHNLVYISDFGNVLGGSSFLWFCVMYMVAAYIRLYVPVQEKHRSGGFAVYAICAVLIAAERFAAYYITPQIWGQVMMESLFYSNNSILNTAAAIALFMAMRTVVVKGRIVNSLIAFLAPLAFGVYLIHDHPALRPLLWQRLNPAALAESPWMIPYALLCVVGIFTICCFLEWLRQQVFRIIGIDKFVNGVSKKIQNRAQLWLDA